MAISYPLTNGEVCQVTFRQNYQGSVCLNVFHYISTIQGTFSGNGHDEVEALVGTLTGGGASLLDALRALQVPTLEHTTQRGQIITPARRPFFDQLNLLPGTGTGEGMPSNVAQVVTKRGDIPGRGRTGSVHITGIPRTAVSEASIVAGRIIPTATFGDILLASVPGLDTALTWTPLVGLKLGSLSDRNELQAYTIQESIRVMRRRTLHVGI